MKEKQKIIIVGAGLCGCLLAIRLAQRGFSVALYEKRADMRIADADSGRSINLALSDRGLKALEIAGLKERVLKESIPMKGRLIHPMKGDNFFSPYSGRPSDHINSISRSGFNILLLNQIEEYDNICLHFKSLVTNVNLSEARIEYLSNHQIKSDKGSIIIGTDGAGSVIRRNMMRHTSELLFNYSQDFLRHGYKELNIAAEPGGQWKIEKEALHIWPRGDFMIIALPNLDGSFTLTMFHPFETEIGLNNLDTDKKLSAFFEEYYPTLIPLIPNYKQEFFTNPVGNLGTVKCYPWQAFGKALIMGDASHAIVPFYGQGMNSSLEDVRVFDQLLDTYGEDWKTLFEKFQDQRKNNTDAIAELALDNFYEMRDYVDDLAFIRKRKIEMQLEKKYKDYSSKYSLVTFNANVSYAEAMKRGRKQDEILLKMCKNKDFDNMALYEFYNQLKTI